MLGLDNQVVLPDLLHRERSSGCQLDMVVLAGVGDMELVSLHMKVLGGSLADAGHSLVEVMVVRHNELLDLVGKKEDHNLTDVEGEELRSLVVEDNLLVAVGSLVVGGIGFAAGIESDLLVGSSILGSTSWLCLLCARC